MSRKPTSPPHIRFPFDELSRFDTLLKHATMGLQFATQAIEGVREIVGSGVVCTDSGPRGSRAKPKRIASARAMLSVREAALQRETANDAQRPVRPRRRRKVGKS